MALPIFNTPSFTQIELLSGKKIGIKPWTVKEEKSLLFAVEGIEKDEDVQKEILKFIAKCVDVSQQVFDSLSNTDCIDILTRLRQLSKGSSIEYSIRCGGEIERKDEEGNIIGTIKCGFELSDDIDLSKHVTRKKFVNTPIKIDEDLTIAIKEVSHTELETLHKKYSKQSEFNYHFALRSISSIMYKGELFEEFTEEELIEFTDQFFSNPFETLITKLDEYGADIVLSKKLKCGKCKHENKVVFGDLYSFLAF